MNTLENWKDPSHETPHEWGTKGSLLVTGASGYLGTRVMDVLNPHHQDIIALYRKKIPDPKPHVFPVLADLYHKEQLSGPLSGVHTVIHMAWDRKAASTERVETNPLNATYNVQCTLNLIEAMEQAKTPRIVFISAIGADRETQDPFLKEKYLCEQIIVNSRIKEKIILRCSVLFGGTREAGFVQAIHNIVKNRLFYPIPQADIKMSPLHVDDFSDLILKCTLVKMYDFCAVLDFVGGDLYSIDTLFKMLAQASNKNAIGVRAFVGDFFVSLFEKYNANQDVKLSDYTVIGSRIEKKIRHKNPLLRLLPERCKSFHEMFSQY